MDSHLHLDGIQQQVVIPAFGESLVGVIKNGLIIEVFAYKYQNMSPL